MERKIIVFTLCVQILAKLFLISIIMIFPLVFLHIRSSSGGRTG